MISKLGTSKSRKMDKNHKSIRVEVEVRKGVTVREATKIGTDRMTGQIAETEDSTDKREVGLDMNNDTKRIIGEVILEGIQKLW